MRICAGDAAKFYVDDCMACPLNGSLNGRSPSGLNGGHCVFSLHVLDVLLVCFVTDGTTDDYSVTMFMPIIVK